MLNTFRVQLVTYESYKPKEFNDLSFFIPNVLHRNFVDILEDAREESRNNQSELWPLDLIEERITNLKAK
jgi:hypothetical protein